MLRLDLLHHRFVARLDPRVDGDANSVYEINTVSLPRGSENPHGNAFRAEETLLASEQAAQRSVHSGSARFWRIANVQQRNRLGRPTSYRLIPGENCPPFVQPDAGCGNFPWRAERSFNRKPQACVFAFTALSDPSMPNAHACGLRLNDLSLPKTFATPPMPPS